MSVLVLNDLFELPHIIADFFKQYTGVNLRSGYFGVSHHFADGFYRHIVSKCNGGGERMTGNPER